MRRLLGHNLDEAHRLLPRFVAYLDSIDATTVTIEAAIAWATDGVDPATTNGARRIGIARGFARHMAGIDEHTEIPPLGLIPMKQRWRPPFLFTPTDIDGLLDSREKHQMEASRGDTRNAARSARRDRDACR